MSRVFKTEFGEYLTYPDGDKATINQIIEYETEKEVKSVNPKYIDINAYKKWRDGLRSDFEKRHSDWMSYGNPWTDPEPSEPDLGVQAYIEHLIDSMPNQGH